MSDGKITLEDKTKNLCSSFQLLGRTYDPADYQTESPLIYLQGDLDPATPIWSARNHFESQKISQDKVFLRVQQTGHSPMKDNINSLNWPLSLSLSLRLSFKFQIFTPLTAERIRKILNCLLFSDTYWAPDSLFGASL